MKRMGFVYVYGNYYLSDKRVRIGENKYQDHQTAQGLTLIRIISVNIRSTYRGIVSTVLYLGLKVKRPLAYLSTGL
jgi:hypothetical protein